MSYYDLYYRYDFCRAIETFLSGYSSVAKMYVGYKYTCEATIVLFLVMIFFLKYMIHLGLELSFGRLPTTPKDVLNKLSWVLAIFAAIGLGYFAVLLLNPIIGLILFIIIFIVFIRLARKK